jgi:anaerobic magnesium-protoporphyrin IX monomethyl ester cyclase
MQKMKKNKKLKKKILFLIPPYNQQLVAERDKEVPVDSGSYPPLGLMYIATYLNNKLKDKVDVKIIDSSLNSWSYKKFEKMLLSYNPDIVCITALTPLILDTKVSLEIIKKVKPTCVTVIGGPHVTSFQEDSMTYPEIDYGIIGYGEDSFYKLVKAIFFDGEINQVNGLLYRKNGEIMKNNIDYNIDLDDLLIPNRTLVPYKKYRWPLGTKKIMATMISSRGCPFQCTFCNSPDKRYKERSAKNLIKEVKYLYKLGIREIFFFDDIFNINNRRVIEFCRLLRKNNLKISWSFRGRVSNLNENVMKELKKANCERIHFGIETHTDESLRRLKKDISIEHVKKAVKLCHKYRINCAGSFMINLPGDTKKDIMGRINFAISLKLDYLQMGILIAYNHTEIFNQGVKKGLWPKNLWLDYIKDPKNDFIAPIWDNGISRKELDELLKYGLKKFYLRSSYIVQRLRKIHSFEELVKTFSGAFKLIKY